MGHAYSFVVPTIQLLSYCMITLNVLCSYNTCTIFSFLVTCTMLTAPTNGMITCSGGDNVPTVGDTCSYTCNTGYVLSGNSMRTCGSGGNWSGTEPTCIGKETDFSTSNCCTN